MYELPIIRWIKRLAWLALIWFLSVASLAIVALLLRFIMTTIGMKVP